MKISTLLETKTLSSDPTSLQSQQAPKFGRDPNVLEDDKLDETTTAGSIASSEPASLGVQRRGSGSLLKGIKTSKKFANSMSVKESVVENKKIVQHTDETLSENLNKWFKEKWVRFGPDGKIRGDCARGDGSEGKPKCLPQSKAQNLGKQGRASAASRKRREDPNPERSGKAINVNTKKKSNEGVAEGYPKHQDLSGVSTDKLKAYLAKQSKQSVPGEGSQVKRVQAELQRREQGVAEGTRMPDANGNYKFHMFAYLRNGDIKEFNVIANGDRNAKILAKKKLIEKGYTNIYSIDIQGMSPVHGPVNYEIDRKLRLEDQGVAEGLEQPKEAFQAIQKLQRFAQDNPDFTLQQLDTLPSRGNPIKPMFANANLAIDTLIQAYKTRKELGNAEFLKQLKDEINYFLTDRTASSDPTTLGDLLQGKLGKINFQQGVAEGMLDNPGQEDSPVAQAIIRRILLQRTDLLAKHGPEKVGQAVDDVADFVGDVDEIGSSDVSGWVRHVEQMLGNMQEGDLDEAKLNCWSGYTRVKGVPAGAPGSCKKKTNEEQSGEKCPECGGPIFSDLMLAEKQDACYNKVKSRYKVWPSAYASGALVQCRKKGAANWGSKSEGIEEATYNRDPEQELIDINRRSAQYREREPRNSDKIDDMIRAQEEQKREYIRTGKFWLKFKDSKKHISGQSYIGKAAATTAALELLKQQPELKGNLLITAYGPDETPMNEAELSEEQLLTKELKKQLALFKKSLDKELVKQPTDRGLGNKPQHKDIQQRKK